MGVCDRSSPYLAFLASLLLFGTMLRGAGGSGDLAALALACVVWVAVANRTRA